MSNNNNNNINSANSQSLSSNTNTKHNFMLNSGGHHHHHMTNGLDLMRNNLTTLTNLYNQNHYINALSSGSSSICASSSNAPLLNCNSGSSANSTQSSSFMTASHMPPPQTSSSSHDTNHMDFDEQDENDADFLVSTSSNLEFLKAHSLFNTTPLNYYPSLNLTKGVSKLDLKMPLEDPPPYDTDASTSQQQQQQQAVASVSITTANQASLTPRGSILNGSTAISPKSSLFDYRFSTFLPPSFPKPLHHELI